MLRFDVKRWCQMHDLGSGHGSEVKDDGQRERTMEIDLLDGRYRVARCPVFNRTVRYFGPLSGIKMTVIPDNTCTMCWKDTLGRKRSFKTHRPPYPTRRGLVTAWQETKKLLHDESGRPMSGRT